VNLDDAATALAGVWLLVEYRDRVSVDDPWFEPYGSEPTGMFVYDPAGHLSVHVAPSVDAPADAKYLGYFGTWTLHEAHDDDGAIVGVVHHVMTGASDAFLLRDEPERIFRLDGDTLTIGDGLTWRRRLVRRSD